VVWEVEAIINKLFTLYNVNNINSNKIISETMLFSRLAPLK